MILAQGTAVNRPVLMIDSADHVSGKTGLTLTITASKNGGAFASISPTVTERSDGWYSLALTTAMTDTLGALTLHITSTGADPTDTNDQVTAAANAWTTVRRGAVTGATTTSTLIDSSLTEAHTDFWAGRILIFQTGTLAGVATQITGFAPGTDTLTFVAVPTAPSAADVYVIV